MEINIALDFSRIPGARYPEEGDFSGQEFRQKILLPKLQPLKITSLKTNAPNLLNLTLILNAYFFFNYNIYPTINQDIFYFGRSNLS